MKWGSKSGQVSGPSHFALHPLLSLHLVQSSVLELVRNIFAQRSHQHFQGLQHGLQPPRSNLSIVIGSLSSKESKQLWGKCFWKNGKGSFSLKEGERGRPVSVERLPQEAGCQLSAHLHVQVLVLACGEKDVLKHRAQNAGRKHHRIVLAAESMMLEDQTEDFEAHLWPVNGVWQHLQFCTCPAKVAAQLLALAHLSYDLCPSGWVISSNVRPICL